MKRVLTYFDNTLHITKDYKSDRFGMTTLCGLKRGTFALNYANLSDVTCEKCKKKFLKNR